MNTPLLVSVSVSVNAPLPGYLYCIYFHVTDERLTGYKRCLCICVSLLLALILLGGVIILVVLLVVIGGQPPRVTTNCGQIEGEFDVLNNVFTYKVIGSSFTLALILRMI